MSANTAIHMVALPNTAKPRTTALIPRASVMFCLGVKHGLPTAPLASRLPLDKSAGGGAVDNPAASPISRQRDRRFTKA